MEKWNTVYLFGRPSRRLVQTYVRTYYPIKNFVKLSKVEKIVTLILFLKTLPCTAVADLVITKVPLNLQTHPVTTSSWFIAPPLLRSAVHFSLSACKYFVQWMKAVHLSLSFVDTDSEFEQGRDLRRSRISRISQNQEEIFQLSHHRLTIDSSSTRLSDMRILRRSLKVYWDSVYL